MRYTLEQKEKLATYYRPAKNDFMVRVQGLPGKRSANDRPTALLGFSFSFSEELQEEAELGRRRLP